MRKPKIGETMIAYLRDENVIGMPTLCVPIIVTDAAELQAENGQKIVVCGAMAIVGPAAQHELGRFKATMPAIAMLAPLRVLHNLPRGKIPPSTCCTWPAIHEAAYPDQFVLYADKPTSPILIGADASPLDLGDVAASVDAPPVSDAGDLLH
jgi:hypothetical protein